MPSRRALAMRSVAPSSFMVPMPCAALVRTHQPTSSMNAPMPDSTSASELGPGSIIKFEKTCDEPLDLCVGGRPIAQGEVVKVGDKFGVKISGLVK